MTVVSKQTLLDYFANTGRANANQSEFEYDMEDLIDTLFQGPQINYFTITFGYNLTTPGFLDIGSGGFVRTTYNEHIYARTVMFTPFALSGTVYAYCQYAGIGTNPYVKITVDTYDWTILTGGTTGGDTENIATVDYFNTGVPGVGQANSVLISGGSISVPANSSVWFTLFRDGTDDNDTATSAGNVDVYGWVVA